MGEIHGILAVADRLIWIQRLPVREETRLAIIQQRRQQNSAVPVAGEVGDLAFRQGCLQPRKHKLSWWELAASDLVANNQRPNQPENEFQISIDDVNVTDVDQLDAIIFNGFQGLRCIFQVVMLIAWPLVPSWLQLFLLQALDQCTQMRSITKVNRQIGDLEKANYFQSLDAADCQLRQNSRLPATRRRVNARSPSF